jgi:hypothetical protein
LYCIETWIYLTATPSNGTQLGIVGWGSYGTTNAVNALKINYATPSSVQIVNYWWGNDLGYTTSPVLAINTWHHIAATFDGTTRRIFFNGVLGASDTPTGHNVTVVNNLSIGKGNESYWAGYLSNLRIVQNSAVYTSAFTPSTIPLTRISGTSVLLNTVSGSPLADSSSNAFVPANSTVPTWNQASPFATGLGYKNRVYTYTGSGTITF